MVLFVNGCVREHSRTIPDVFLVKAEGLDIWGNHPSEILMQAKNEISRLLHL